MKLLQHQGWQRLASGWAIAQLREDPSVAGWETQATSGEQALHPPIGKCARHATDR